MCRFTPTKALFPGCLASIGTVTIRSSDLLLFPCCLVPTGLVLTVSLVDFFTFPLSDGSGLPLFPGCLVPKVDLTKQKKRMLKLSLKSLYKMIYQ